jgi:hypothetical protein
VAPPLQILTWNLDELTNMWRMEPHFCIRQLQICGAIHHTFGIYPIKDNAECVATQKWQRKSGDVKVVT